MFNFTDADFDAYERARSAAERAGIKYGYLGKPDGNGWYTFPVSGRPGKFYARIGKQDLFTIAEVSLGTVTIDPRLEVIIELIDGELVATRPSPRSARTLYGEYAPYAHQLPPNGTSGTGGNVVFARNIDGLRLTTATAGGLTVRITEGWYGDTHWDGSSTTTLVPTTTSGVKSLVLVGIDPATDTYVTERTADQSLSVDLIDNLSLTADGAADVEAVILANPTIFWSGCYELANGDTVISDAKSYDLRFQRYPVMVGADGISAGRAGLVPAPAATDNTKYLKGDGTYGTPTGASAYDTVEDEGVAVTQRTTVNFVGAGVSVADSGGKTTVTINGGSTLDEIVLHEEQPSGTYGGTFNNGAWRTRAINTKVKDTGTNASIITLAFTSGGTYVVAAGNTITGATSGATATVFDVEITSGSWAGGDAAGTLWLNSQSGTFQSENLNVGVNSNVATIAGNSAISSSVRVKSGEYSVTARCPAHAVSGHRCRLYDVTNSAVLAVGSNSYVAVTAMTDSVLFGRFTLAANATLRLEHRCTASRGTDGFGLLVSSGDNEVYATMRMIKL